jgi:hypothetical protein
MGKTKGTVHFILVISLLAIGPLSAMAGKYVTLSDIRDEVKDGWHETYEAQGSTIVVDVAIQVPEVDAVPAVCVALPSASFEQNLPELPTTDTVMEADGFGYTVSAPNQSIFSLFPVGDSIFLSGPEDRAENSPLSREEAVEFYINLAKQYEDVFGPQDPEVRILMPRSRLYRLLKTGYVNELDMNQPLNETGYYFIKLYQRFHGIPYLQPHPPVVVPNSGKRYPVPMGEIAGYIASKEDYSFSMHPAVEVSVVSEDLPLATFAQAKAEFEKRIKAGYIREVYSVRFGYLAYYNPDNLEKDLILMPVWELRGNIVDEARFPTPVPPAGAEEYWRMMIGTVALVNAQTGTIIDPKDGRAESRSAKFLTWDQVGK